MGDGLKRVAKQCGGLIASDGKRTVRYNEDGEKYFICIDCGRQRPFEEVGSQPANGDFRCIDCECRLMDK